MDFQIKEGVSTLLDSRQLHNSFQKDIFRERTVKTNS